MAATAGQRYVRLLPLLRRAPHQPTSGPNVDCAMRFLGPRCTAAAATAAAVAGLESATTATRPTSSTGAFAFMHTHVSNDISRRWQRPRFVSCLASASMRDGGTATRSTLHHYSAHADDDAGASSPVVDDGAAAPPLPPSSPSGDFATDYHAPVMVRECVDALLGVGLGSERGGGKKKRGGRRRRRGEGGGEEEEEERGGRGRAGVDVSSSEEQGGGSASADRPPLLFVDGTLGGGGHTAALLERLRPGDVVLGCDVDPSALSAASERLGRYTAKEGGGGEEPPLLPLFVPVRSNFRDLSRVLPRVRHPATGRRILDVPGSSSGSGGGNAEGNGDDADVPDADGSGAMFAGVDGLLLDLGVSSHQIDTPSRGFAFMRDGPLDMRLWNGEWSTLGAEAVNGDGAVAGGGGGGLTAADICNEFDEAELSRILKTYGDEPRSRKIASSIIAARPLRTTSDLVGAVSEVTPEFARKGRRMGRTATLARVFQSLRIVVNEEDGALAGVLEGAAPDLVRPGGRLVVLSYHSMEDRAAKRVLRDGAVRGPRGGMRVEKDVYGNVVGQPRPWKPLGKKRKATEEEVATNPRARSATLRIGERQDEGQSRNLR